MINLLIGKVNYPTPPGDRHACPNCGSKNLFANLSYLGTHPTIVAYACGDCDYFHEIPGALSELMAEANH